MECASPLPSASNAFRLQTLAGFGASPSTVSAITYASGAESMHHFAEAPDQSGGYPYAC